MNRLLEDNNTMFCYYVQETVIRFIVATIITIPITSDSLQVTVTSCWRVSVFACCYLCGYSVRSLVRFFFFGALLRAVFPALAFYGNKVAISDLGTDYSILVLIGNINIAPRIKTFGGNNNTACHKKMASW